MLVNINNWYVNPLNVTYVNPTVKENKTTKKEEKMTEVHFSDGHSMWTPVPSFDEIVKIISDGLVAIQKGRFSKKRKRQPKKQLGGTEK